MLLQGTGESPAEKIQLLSRTCSAQKDILRAGRFPQHAQPVETKGEIKLALSAKLASWLSLKVKQFLSPVLEEVHGC